MFRNTALILILGISFTFLSQEENSLIFFQLSKTILIKYKKFLPLPFVFKFSFEDSVFLSATTFDAECESKFVSLLLPG